MAADALSDLAELVIAGDGEAAKALTAKLIADGLGARQVLDEGLMPGMDTVGARMKAGQCFIPEVLLSARTMQACLELIKPHLAAGDSAQRGTIVIGTVEGDVHDIGKNIVKMMLEGAGYEVVDLGVDVSADAFVSAVQREAPRFVLMSALITLTMESMRRTVEALRLAGVRDAVAVGVGGAPVTQKFADELGVEIYALDAYGCVEACNRVMSNMQPGAAR